jgi:hypothetical protein
MNERIRQLARQSTGASTIYMLEEEWLKFAELIVKEMLVTCEEHPAWTGRMIGEQIKQYFGVKE